MVRWIVRHWEQLTAGELYRLLVLRQRVFVVEQTCPYLDADGSDLQAWHLWAEREGEVIACARLFAPGVKYAEASIGRIATAPEVRGTGVGRALVARSLATLYELLGEELPVRIGAQRYLERFYGSFGFVPDGEAYLEDDIPHLPMRKPAR